jgi:NAD(P)-dependent dehydrogenase (short-subunit alcohol dehydrogenase family)
VGNQTVGRQVVVVTGGGGGMGVAVARRLAGPDVDLLLADVSADALAQAVGTLADAGIGAEPVVWDAGDPEAAAALAARVADRGALGALVHTAGLAPPGATDPRAVLEVNLLGTVRLLDAFEPLVTTGSAGVVVASLAAHRSFAQGYDDLLDAGVVEPLLERLAADGYEGSALAAYSVTKAGVVRLVQRRAHAWGARGGRLNSVSPGLVLDTAIGRLAAGASAASYAQESALGRAGTSADVAGVVAFLAGPDAAYVTGTDVLVDGGTLAAVEVHRTPAARAAWHAAR